MIELSRDLHSARILPQEGAVVGSLRIAGHEVLSHGPAANEPEQARPLARTEEAWVRAWRGGWQLCFPTTGQADPRNAGQGFHGSASQSPWTPVHATADSVELHWHSDDLVAERRWTLHDDGLSATTTARNTGSEPVQLAIAEHLILGGAILRHPLDVRVPGGTVMRPLDYAGLPGGDPAPWPGEAHESWERVDTETAARVVALTPPPGQRTIGVRGPHVAADVTWEGEAFPHALLWEELGSTAEEPWNRAVHALGIEPTTTPHGAGTRHPEGAILLAAGAELSWSCRLRITWKEEAAR